MMFCGEVSLNLKYTARQLVAIAIFLGCTTFSSAQVSLSTVVSLALRNSPTVQMAEADIAKASNGLSEAKVAYVPNFVLGSGLGYSYGFPVGQPSIYNVTSQSLLYNAGQSSYIHSAQSSLKASQLASRDARQQVILDTALSYIQLDKTIEELNALDQESGFSEKLISIEQSRLYAGVASRTEFTQARLTAAQIHLKHIHLENDRIQLQQKLSHLTGLPASQIIPVKESVPPMPSFNTKANLQAQLPLANSNVLAARAIADSKTYIAKGDRLQNYRPQVVFAAQYNRYAEYNNYELYYRNFQHNNFGIGVEISLPLFDATRRAKAHQSDAEALRAKVQAAQALQQTEEAVVTLQTSLDELQAQAEVAGLKNELAQDQLSSVLAQLENGTGSASTAPLTPKDEQAARIEERQRFEDSLDASFELTKAQLNLLRMLGTIEDWAKIQPNP
jgi:outer membrane protein TolC